MDVEPDMLAHYEITDEADRLTTRARLEGERTRELLHRFLPKAPAYVLDVGGAEGAYALPLARNGYRVHLIDPVPRHVAAAKANSEAQPDAPLAHAQIGDARDLSTVADHSVDAVLLFGPLYHLVDAADRARALAEARRVLKSGGRLMAAAISRFASVIDGLTQGHLLDPRFPTMVDGVLDTGVHRNPDVAGRPDWFTLAYFHRPEELAAEVGAAGFVDAKVLPVEGPVGALAPNVEAALDDPDQRATIMNLLDRIEDEPALLGASAHMMVVATAP